MVCVGNAKRQVIHGCMVVSSSLEDFILIIMDKYVDEWSNE